MKYMGADEKLYGQIKGLSERHGASSACGALIGCAAVAATMRLVKETLGSIEDRDTSKRCILNPKKRDCNDRGGCEGVGYLAPCFDDSYGVTDFERFYQYFDDNSGFWILVDRKHKRVVNGLLPEQQNGFRVYPDDFS